MDWEVQLRMESVLAELTFRVEADPDGGNTQRPLKEAVCLPYPGRYGAKLLGEIGVHLTWPVLLLESLYSGGATWPCPTKSRSSKHQLSILDPRVHSLTAYPASLNAPA